MSEKPRYDTVEAALIKLKKDVSEVNYRLITEFIDHWKEEFFENNSRLPNYKTVCTYIVNLKAGCKLIEKDLNQLNKDDKIKIITTSRRDVNLDMKKFAEWHYKDFTERFSKWKIPNTEPKQDFDILSEDEIKKIVNASKYDRDKALIMLCYELGLRPDEILSLKIKHFRKTEQGHEIIIWKSKTLKRNLPIIMSVPFLTRHIENHPHKDDSESSLWLQRENKQLSYDGFRMLLKRLGTQAGITKRMNPYILRKSRANFCANAGWNKYVMDSMFGWSKTGNTSAFYINSSKIDLRKQVEVMNGIKPKDEIKESKLKPKTCEICKEINPTTNHYCVRCSNPLDMKQALEDREKLGNLGKAMQKIQGQQGDHRELLKEAFKEMIKEGDIKL